MKSSKKKIILDEIKYWKKHKLLPNHYCDFLTTLYTEGSEYSTSDVKKDKSHYSFLWKKMMVSLVLALTAISTLLVFYFSDFSIQMQISIHILFILFLSTVFIYGLYRDIFVYQSLPLLLITAWALWYTIDHWNANFNWIRFEGTWVACALLLVGCAWFIRHMNKKLCLTLYITGVILFFAPILQGGWVEQASLTVLQTLAVSKLIIYGLTLWLWQPYRYILEFDRSDEERETSRIQV
ncbi:hypothetical protein [Caldalkalibacillus salinus]|uniref:hypothetical protein n=1 Tax=Caldalkalibacillus salinus TaxID=2803787 RepID=UPI0019227D54|nr:hypothetical protein [Caldalkalibacillus salinus]